MKKELPPIIQVGDVLLSPDIITEQFCCDLTVCKGRCCIEGDAGAPVALDEIMEIENMLDTVWSDLSASAQAVVDHQGVAYTDREGDLVTSIVGGKDCVFTCYGDIEVEGQTVVDCCLCALERACRQGKSRFCKPISCALYPIRAKVFSNGTVGLNYHRWDICQCGRDKGRQLDLPLYRFLEGPLVKRFGQTWYDELCNIAAQLAP
jgi:hypothetical protein